MKTILLLALMAGAVFGAPSTPITRGRLTTDLDAAGHSITNSPMATTNFVWEVVGSVTTNLPSGGTDGGAVTNIVNDIVADATNGVIRVDEYGIASVPGEIFVRDGIEVLNGGIQVSGSITSYGSIVANYQLSSQSVSTREILLDGSDVTTVFAARTNLPSLSASSTVGDLVDAYNAIANAMRPKEEP